jgi:AcrR family transcriptional regulator
MNKRQRIVDAARQRFRYYGIGKTTMQEIATDAGVAVGTLYLYFSNKDDLVVACALEYAKAHRHSAEKILSKMAPADRKLRAYLVDRFRRSEQTRTSSRHAAEITRAVLRVQPDRVREEGLIMYDAIVEILKQGVAAGQFRVANPEEDAKVLLFSIAGFFPNALAEPPIVPRKADLLKVVDWFIGAWKSAARSHKRPSRRPPAALRRNGNN